MATLIPFAGLQAMPWKNGGGSTTEIAVWPHGAGLDSFVWRISMATIAGDGPFSIFAGIDRTLSLVRGAGVDLQIEGQQQVALRASDPTLSFPGEWPVYARLPDGVTQDFNVMTRRSQCRHEFVRIGGAAASGQDTYTRKAPTTLLFLASDTPLHWRSGAQVFAMQQHDSVLLQAGDGITCTWQGEAQADASPAAACRPEWFAVEIFI